MGRRERNSSFKEDLLGRRDLIRFQCSCDESYRKRLKTWEKWEPVAGDGDKAERTKQRDGQAALRHIRGDGFEEAPMCEALGFSLPASVRQL